MQNWTGTAFSTTFFKGSIYWLNVNLLSQVLELDNHERNMWPISVINLKLKLFLTKFSLILQNFHILLMTDKNISLCEIKKKKQKFILVPILCCSTNQHLFIIFSIIIAVLLNYWWGYKTKKLTNQFGHVPNITAFGYTFPKKIIPNIIFYKLLDLHLKISIGCLHCFAQNIRKYLWNVKVAILIQNPFLKHDRFKYKPPILPPTPNKRRQKKMPPMCYPVWLNEIPCLDLT